MAMNRATKVLTEVKRAMWKSGLKILETERVAVGVTAKYIFRGYHEEMILLNDFLRAQCMIRMSAYMGLDTSKYCGTTTPDSKPITS